MQEGKGGTYYPPFPVLGLASNGKQTFVIAGGGGALAAKEVPNLVQAHRYDEATGKLSAIASLNAQRCSLGSITYSQSTGYWLVSCQSGCKVLVLNEGACTLDEVCEFQTETEGKSPSQNVAVHSPDGQTIATGGTDGIVRFWSWSGSKEQPTMKHACAKNKEVNDLDYNMDGTKLASCDQTGVCRIWDAAGGQELLSISFAGPKKEKLNARGVRFIPPKQDPAERLVLAASGQRGPAYLGVYDMTGAQLATVLVDSKPLTALAVDYQGKYAGVNLATGGKRVYSLPNLKCLKKANNIHELPAPVATMMGEGTFISGSGDYCINILRFKVTSQGSSCSSFLLFVLLLVAVLVVLYMVGKIGIKGAMLGQGGGEL